MRVLQFKEEGAGSVLTLISSNPAHEWIDEGDKFQLIAEWSPIIIPSDSRCLERAKETISINVSTLKMQISVLKRLSTGRKPALYMNVVMFNMFLYKDDIKFGYCIDAIFAGNNWKSVENSILIRANDTFREWKEMSKRG